MLPIRSLDARCLALAWLALAGCAAARSAPAKGSEAATPAPASTPDRDPRRPFGGPEGQVIEGPRVLSQEEVAAFLAEVETRLFPFTIAEITRPAEGPPGSGVDVVHGESRGDGLGKTVTLRMVSPAGEPPTQARIQHKAKPYSEVTNLEFLSGDLGGTVLLLSTPDPADWGTSSLGFSEVLLVDPEGGQRVHVSTAEGWTVTLRRR